MSCCSAPRGYEKFFGERTARRDARRFRKRGLDATARRMVDFLGHRGIEGRSVLEVGGGVGAIQLELLRAGAASAVNVELSPAYEEEARVLLQEAGLEGRVDRRLGDFAQEAEAAQPADAVVMHRVVCCYPDFEAMISAAAKRARRHLVFSFPRETRLIRLGIGLANVWYRLRGSSFRAYVHSPAAMLAVAEAEGLRRALEHRGLVWQVAALERAG